MTTTKAIIIKMIGEGLTNKKIVAYTGHDLSYINKIRRGIEKQRKIELVKRIREFETQAAPKPKKDYSGYNQCLHEDCNERFFTDDKRYHHFCPRHDASRFGVYTMDGPDHKWFGARRAAR